MGKVTPLLIVTASGCPWCKMLLTDIVPNLRAYGIEYKVVKTNKKVKEAFEIEGYPALVYLNEDGTRGLYLEEGYVTFSRILDVMKSLVNGEDPDDN